MLSKDVCVFTDEDFDLINYQRKKQPLFSKLSSKKSSSLINPNFSFGGKLVTIWKITLPLRIIVFIILPVLKKFVKILIVDTYYDKFLKTIYKKYPQLKNNNYKNQIRTFWHLPLALRFL